MQAIKEKFNDMSAMHKAKAEAKEEEKAEKELAKARVEVAHEVRLAREAEAAMDLHVNKAAERVAEHERKHHHPTDGQGISGEENYMQDSHGRTPNSPENPIGGGAVDSATAGIGYGGSRSAGGPPTHNNLL